MSTQPTAGGLGKPACSTVEPGRDCPRCPRLVSFRRANRAANPGWFNAPVPSFGPRKARLLIVGLAPGLRGANRTGRPFTGDFAGDLLYRTLLDFGFARGIYAARADDGLELVDVRIVNSVRCVPPENKPTPEEIRTCREFLAAEIAAMPDVKAIVALGKVAHDSTLAVFGERLSRCKFAHGAEHKLASLMLFDSYHCSRYNTNTGVLTPKMFRSVFAKAHAYLRRAA
jgi:uracil-DNA glycosylase family 4